MASDTNASFFTDNNAVHYDYAKMPFMSFYSIYS